MPNYFEFSADLANLPAARRFVRENAQWLCSSEAFLYDLELAVDEVVTNIIVHGYQGAPGDIRIEVQPRAGGLEVVIKDHAPLFDPSRAPDPDLALPLEQRKPGGLGIVLVRGLMDGIIYTPGITNGNELTLIKRCPADRSAAGRA
jgi:serine/threonine-protein kinase RsbW